MKWHELDTNIKVCAWVTMQKKKPKPLNNEVKRPSIIVCMNVCVPEFDKEIPLWAISILLEPQL
jgi:hypothetical protein